MGLAFLVPAFLAGLLAIGLPIWVHLRNRPKTDTVEFPSLMFISLACFAVSPSSSRISG